MRILFLAVSTALLVSCIGYTSNKRVGEVYYDLGNAYMELDRHEDAIKAYSHALGLNKDFALARYNLARTFAIRNDYKKALETAYSLLRDDPDSLIFRELVAWIFYLSKDYEKAIESYEAVLEIDSIRETALFNLAVLYAGKEDLESSIGFLTKLSTAYPDNGKYVFKLGDALYKNEDYIGARDVFSSIEEGSVDSVFAKDFYYDYGSTLEHIQDYTGAVALYVKGQELEEETDTDVFFFLEGKIQWNIFEDEEGAKTLFDTSIEKGFRDKQQILTFIENSETLNPEKLIAYFDGKGLYDPEANQMNEKASEDSIESDDGAVKDVSIISEDDASLGLTDSVDNGVEDEEAP